MMNTMIRPTPRIAQTMKTRSFLLAVALAFATIVPCGCFSSGQKQEREANEYLDDKVIQARVEQALREETWYDFSRVRVRATNGTVYLSGLVPTEEARSLAADTARQRERVKAVNNALVVRP